MKSRQERIVEFVNRLAAAPASASAEGALALLASELMMVEDAHSGVKYDPDFPTNDGRMYPPREDARREVPGHPDVRRYRSRGHNVYVSESGALLIQEIGGDCLLIKPDNKGRTITL